MTKGQFLILNHQPYCTSTKFYWQFCKQFTSWSRAKYM